MRRNKDGRVVVDFVLIKEKIFETELINYRLVEREQMIDDLIMWLSECKNNDKFAMRTDLKYLIGLDDEYIFSSIITNEYIAESDNPERWEEICKEILKLNKKRLK